MVARICIFSSWLSLSRRWIVHALGHWCPGTWFRIIHALFAHQVVGVVAGLGGFYDAFQGVLDLQVLLAVWRQRLASHHLPQRSLYFCRGIDFRRERHGHLG